MRDFKVRDKVRCIEATSFSDTLLKNRTYIITEVRADGKVALRGGLATHSWYHWRFEKVKPNPRKI